MANHYCTYFDRGFAIQGLALWRSLARHDPEAVLWVLALDEATAKMFGQLGEPQLKVVPLAILEAGDPSLSAAKNDRSRIEYYFTLSPCWPRWLMLAHPEIDRLTYLDADLFFFDRPAPILQAMKAAQASILITSHRLPPWLRHYEQHGRFNVGVLSFRNDAVGRACLDQWRQDCLAWCRDRVEADRYADQKYLDAWPTRYGEALLVLAHPGVNLAPWNWSRCRIEVGDSSGAAVTVDDQPLVVFHFARFRPKRGDGWWQSGQLDYGIMPRRFRAAIYGPYFRALMSARADLQRQDPGFDFERRPARLNRDYWRGLPLRMIFGGDWLRIGGQFWNLRCGIGQWSGRVLAALRRWFRRQA